MTFVEQPPALVAGPPPAKKYDFVSIYHPSNDREFLSLPRVDEVLDTDSNTVKRMLHTKTALSICYIIACNNSGYFASQQDRTTAIKIETDFLDNEKVFYHLSDETIPIQYPLCTKFWNWKFPYDGPLEDWVPAASDLTDDIPGMVPSSISDAVKQRDKTCRVTGYHNCLNSCHLIPSAEDEWFLRNGMKKFNISTQAGVDDLRNSIALRADLYYAFDTGSYAFAPRDGVMRVYFISDRLNNYMQYHNHSISTANVHVNFLYARFAWAVLKNIEATLKRQQQHFNILGNSQGPGDGDEGGDDGDGNKKGSRKKAQDSTKRKRSGSQDGQQQLKTQKTGAQGLTDDMDSEDDSDGANFPFFSDPAGTAPPHLYKTLNWYPGIKKVEEEKQRWMAEHPNIRSVGGTEFADSSSDVSCDAD